MLIFLVYLLYPFFTYNIHFRDDLFCFEVLGLELRVLGMLGKWSATWLYLKPIFWSLYACGICKAGLVIWWHWSFSIPSNCFPFYIVLWFIVVLWLCRGNLCSLFPWLIFRWFRDKSSEVGFLLIFIYFFPAKLYL